MGSVASGGHGRAGLGGAGGRSLVALGRGWAGCPPRGRGQLGPGRALMLLSIARRDGFGGGTRGSKRREVGRRTEGVSRWFRAEVVVEAMLQDVEKCLSGG